MNKTYSGTPILKDVSLTVEDGTVSCLLGPSGSGKSTLLRVMNGLVNANSGYVRLGSDVIGNRLVERRGVTELVPLGSREQSRQRRKIGMVFQQFNLFPHMTVAQNLDLGAHYAGIGSRRERSDSIDRLLDLIGLPDKRDAYPGELSGGQQQRVAIARALMVEPEVMLFDEPTSALDPELVSGVLKIIKTLSEQGMTLVIVTHEMRFARDVADQVVFLADGSVCETGTPAEFFTKPKTERARAFLDVELHTASAHQDTQ
ncbi:amino acid ABC transporter ATP-binding protein [Williamsia limnetica]|uniref:amino acid ABC transporter ATP-binding protein n=1 Tax=Williamsia limnetica TaxID=882452 RepID=UPI00319DA44A